MVCRPDLTRNASLLPGPSIQVSGAEQSRQTDKRHVVDFRSDLQKRLASSNPPEDPPLPNTTAVLKDRALLVQTEHLLGGLESQAQPSAARPDMHSPSKASVPVGERIAVLWEAVKDSEFYVTGSSATKGLYTIAAPPDAYSVSDSNPQIPGGCLCGDLTGRGGAERTDQGLLGGAGWTVSVGGAVVASGWQCAGHVSAADGSRLPQHAPSLRCLDRRSWVLSPLLRGDMDVVRRSDAASELEADVAVSGVSARRQPASA
eukprot:3252851-Rhodomonas_salina.1